jgi:hypothetical protein
MRAAAIPRPALAAEAKAHKAGRHDFSFQGAFLAEMGKSGAPMISSREGWRIWLESLPPEQRRAAAIVTSARAALRVVPFVARKASTKTGDDVRRFLNLAFSVFSASSLAWIAAKYPNRADTLRIYPAAAAAGTRAAAPEAAAAGKAADAVSYSKPESLSRLKDLYVSVAGQSIEAAAFADYKFAYNALVTWVAISRDVEFMASGGSTQTLASQPLWPNGAPDQHKECWELLQKALPSDGDWQVWIDWYIRRLNGVSDREEIELVFANVPDKEREAGPAAANKWIKERLEELQKKESPPPEIPPQGPGPHVEIDAETGAVVPAKPESLDAEGNNLARLNAHHPRIVQLAGELLANLGRNEQPELFAAAKSYFDNVSRDLSQIDFERLWGEGVYLEEAEAAAARRIKDAMREPLNDAALAALKALLQMHGPFILATKAGLENLAFANAYEIRPDEAKGQRAAAIELAQEFKANPDVVAPETVANFVHFAEQPESTTHPERSAAFTLGMVQNIAIVTTAGATIGAIIAEVGSETGPVVAGAVALTLIEGLKKTKPFLEVAGLVTDGLNQLSEADARALWERLKSKIPFDRYKQFVLGNEALWRRLAGAGKQFRWLHEHLDWLKRMNEPPK